MAQTFGGYNKWYPLTCSCTHMRMCTTRTHSTTKDANSQNLFAVWTVTKVFQLAKSSKRPASSPYLALFSALLLLFSLSPPSLLLLSFSLFVFRSLSSLSLSLLSFLSLLSSSLSSLFLSLSFSSSLLSFYPLACLWSWFLTPWCILHRWKRLLRGERTQTIEDTLQSSERS